MERFEVIATITMMMLGGITGASDPQAAMIEAERSMS